MTPDSRTKASIELLDAIMTTPRPADGVATAFFRARRYMGSGDRGDVSARVYAILRSHARLGWWLERAGAGRDDARARAIAWLMLGEEKSFEEVEALFTDGRYGPEELSAAERALLRSLSRKKLEPDDMPGAVRVECPDWAEPSLRAAFDGRFEEEMRALLVAAPVDIRANEARGTRDEARAGLKKSGIHGSPTRWSPLALRIEGRPPLAGHPLFKAGAIEIQDEGSQLIALLADARPGMQVVDFCAGAGGKALAMAARMGGKGRIVACDVSQGRLIRSRERIRRAGIDNVEPRVLTTERDKWVKRQKGKFDRVLIDAPCSGVGAWRRNPDARWRQVDLAELTALQGRILESAARLAKPGGRVIYATCSLLPEENEKRVETFLAADPSFRLIPVPDAWATVSDGPCPTAEPMLRLTPATHQTDGFFLAILEKAETARDKAAEVRAE